MSYGRSMSDGADEARLRVMVVDDHPMWRDAVERDLQDAGYDVVAVGAPGPPLAATRGIHARRQSRRYRFGWRRSSHDGRRASRHRIASAGWRAVRPFASTIAAPEARGRTPSV